MFIIRNEWKDRTDGFISPSKRIWMRRLRGVLSDRFKVITSTNKISMKFILVRCLEILFGFIQSNDRVITIKQKYTEFMTKKIILFCRLDCHYCKIFFSLFLLVLFSKKYIWDHKTVLKWLPAWWFNNKLTQFKTFVFGSKISSTLVFNWWFLKFKYRARILNF